MFGRKRKVTYREVETEDSELSAVSDRCIKIARVASIMIEEGITIKDMQDIVIYNALENIKDTNTRNMIITLINGDSYAPIHAK
jgi:hypothetical protein